MRSCCILYLLKCDGGATMEIKCMCVLLCGAMTLLVSGQFVPPSPCPEIFNYQNNGQEIYGTIRYQPSGRATTVVLRANFTVKATLPSRYVGQLEVLGAKQQVLQSILRGQPLEYRVHFPVTSPVPRLSVITVNGNVLCFGPPEIAGPGEAVTSVSLDHMLYANDDNGNPSLNLDPAYNTVPNKNPMIYLDNDNTFMINPDTLNLDNNEPSFVINTITIPNRHSAQNVPQQYPQQIYPQQQTTLPPQQYFPQQQPSNAPPVQFQVRPVQTPQMAPNPTSVECGIPSGGNERVPLVFHGSAVSRGDWPWVVAVYVRRENALLFICSGSLISNQHILTAAHCMHQKTSLTAMRDIVVKVGVYNLDDWSDDNAVTRSLSAANIHPNYNSNTLENDILLMTLDKTVTYTNYIRPVCLWEGGISLSAIVGQTASVIGWGTSEVSPSGHGEPRLASLPIVSTETCRASRAEFHKLTSDKTICAGDRNGAGPCNGDSGGGLYMLVGGRWLLRGVVSLSLRPVTGDNTCNLNEYVVFTDAAQYLPWVRQYFGVG